MKKVLLIIIGDVIIIYLCWLFIPLFGHDVFYCEKGDKSTFLNESKICILPAEGGEYSAKTKHINNFEMKTKCVSFLEHSYEKDLYFLDTDCNHEIDYTINKTGNIGNRESSEAARRARDCVLYGNIYGDCD